MKQKPILVLDNEAIFEELSGDEELQEGLLHAQNQETWEASRNQALVIVHGSHANRGGFNPTRCIIDYHTYVERVLNGAEPPPVAPYAPATLIHCNTRCMKERDPYGIMDPIQRRLDELRKQWHMMFGHQKQYSCHVWLNQIRDVVRRRLALKQRRLARAQNAGQSTVFSTLEDAYLKSIGIDHHDS